MAASSIIGSIGVGTCSCHQQEIGATGVLVTGSNNIIASYSPASLLNSIMLSECGHIGIVVSGSSTVFGNNSSRTRVGDVFIGCFTGIIASGVSSIQIGG
jgi:hypothetical protein